MRRRWKMLSMLLVVFFLVPLFAQPAFTTTYGTKDVSATWFFITDFLQMHPAGITPYECGYWRRSDSGTGRHFYATLNLPSGVEIKDITLHYYDNDSDNSILLYYYVYHTDTRDRTYIESEPSENIEYGTLSIVPPAELNRFCNYDIYKVVVYVPTADPNLRFKGVRIQYQRQVSLAPATSSFIDVSPTMQFFPYIEALRASGITTGYSDGTFRPDEPVNRGQMAAFLARALGLHHPGPQDE